MIHRSEVKIARAFIPEGRVLRFLHAAFEDSLRRATDARLRRLYFLQQLVELSEAGEIAVVWSGRDCDNVRYANAVRIVPADKALVDNHIEETYAWADGPCSYYLERPSVAQGLSYRSRDLAAEAFEDGHPHYIIDTLEV